MVDLARQAFSTNNFGLAAEIYERTIKENGPQAELFLGLADSFARGGHFTKAFEAYTKAFRLGRVKLDKLKHLVTALIENLSQDSVTSGGQAASMDKNCMFTCVLCRGLYNDPVTIKCGHTFCRKCLERDRSKTCKVCGIVHYRLKASNIKTNVVFSNLIRKWFPDSCRAAELKAEGNKFFEKRDFQRAISFYSEAISLSDADHLLFSNRSHAYASLDQHEKALEDAARVVKMRPDWPKGFFRKGTALYGLGHYEDAVIAFLQCLTLDKEVTSAKEYLSKSLHMVLSQLPPDDPKSLQRQRECSPTVFQTLINSNFNMAAVLPRFTADTLSHLKQIMDDTYQEASNFQNPQPSSSAQSQCTAASAEECMEYVEGSATSSLEKQRCNSVPTLDNHVAAEMLACQMIQRQRSRSQSPSQRGDDCAGSRKRCRHPSVTQPCSPSRSSPQKCLKSEADGSTVAVNGKEIDASLLDADDLECSLCYRLFHQPVTTPCGHTFCRQCLDRCLDHQTSCPMCKSCLSEYLAERRSTMTECLQAIIVTYFQAEFAERQKVHEEELSELAKMGLDTQHEIPVFVCTLGFPTVLCPLHIFEPRYRLMIRQCMETGTRQFGMCTCLTDDEENFSDYGCMLEVRDVHFFPDGRSLVDTIGGRRFRVLSRGKREGYNTAKVEFLQDEPLNETEVPEIQKLQDEIYGGVQRWLEHLPAFHKARISQHFGELPAREPTLTPSTNGPAWAWWCVAVLPIDTGIQLAVLAMCSYRQRLEALKKVLKYLNNRHL